MGCGVADARKRLDEGDGAVDFAYGGFESALAPMSEAKNPGRGRALRYLWR